MPLVLIILGAVVALAGLGLIAAGMPAWAAGMGYGSAFIESGAIGLLGGFLLVGLGFVLRALRELNKRLDMIAPGAPIQARPGAAARPPMKRESVPAPARREPPSFGGREDAREPALLDRENGPGLDEDRPRPRTRFGDMEPRMAPRPSAPPERGRPRPPLPERAPPANSGPSFAEYEDDAPPPPRKSAAANSGGGMSNTIVRSGIIGGMAYTLYTDGSIEAELPIGTVRFASIEELQDHVSQTGEDADVDFGAPQPPKNDPLR